jgi:hypothetical protein
MTFKVISTSAFNFNLRRYNWATKLFRRSLSSLVGRCRLPL